MNNSISAAQSKEAVSKTAHEYIREILPFRYQECSSCGNRTDLACLRCGYCYSCHWKKEKEERRLLEDEIGEIFPSPLYDVRKGMEKIVQPSHGKRQQHIVVDVYGRTSEAICTYHGCDHKFSVHGIGSCKCKHPTNRTLGVLTRYL